MTFENVHFENANGDTLDARLDMPDDSSPRACALFAHCFTCSKDLKAVGAISKALTEQGFAVLRFDFTGLGRSEGDFADTNFSSDVEDLVAAARYMGERNESPAVLIGHSLGGAAVLQAAHRIDSVQAVATVGAPAEPEHVSHLFDDSIETIEATGEANVTLAGRSFTIKKQFIDDLESTRMHDTIRSLDRALMIFHSPVDQTVGVENAAEIFQAAKHPKSFVSLDRANHLLTDTADAMYVGHVLSAWARKYIDDASEATDASHSSATEKTEKEVVEGVETRTGEGFRTTIRTDVHRLVADEPESYGGTNTGPTPYDFLMAGLGACTGMTLRMYADRKDVPLDETVVRLSHEKVHAKDCEECMSSSGKVDRIERTIEIRGDLTEKQRARMMEIADKCPVHRSLHNEIHVVSHRSDPEPEPAS